MSDNPDASPAPSPSPAAGGESVAVYVCTFRRNDRLTTLLSSVAAAAERVQPRHPVGVVVVDDNADGRAEPVVEAFQHPFQLGLHYTHTGSQNISTARNRGVETAMGIGDWVAMTDDDQTVSEQWLEELFATQQRFDADAVTGPVFIQYDDDSPAWLRNQPFDEIFEAQPRTDGEQVDTCSTGNSMIRTAWLEAHPEVRFRNDLGELGGEDMVFYRGAIERGLQARYATRAEAYQVQPPERVTFGATLYSSYWLGNNMSLSNFEAGQADRARLVLRGAKKLAEAAARPARQAAGRRPVEVQFAAAQMAMAAGMISGALGVKAKHR